MHIYWRTKEIQLRILFHQKPLVKENGKFKLNAFDIPKCLFVLCMLIFYFYFSDDGIVIAISIWQCLFEFLTNCSISSIILIQDQNFVTLQLLLFITFFFNYVIYPSFYLLADSRFRKVLTQNGSLKAIWSALKQKYDWIAKLFSANLIFYYSNDL